MDLPLADEEDDKGIVQTMSYCLTPLTLFFLLKRMDAPDLGAALISCFIFAGSAEYGVCSVSVSRVVISKRAIGAIASAFAVCVRVHSLEFYKPKVGDTALRVGKR